MANTVSQITYSNTFAQWVVSTNQLIKENNDLATGSYYKNQGTLYLNSPVGLYVANSAGFAGNTSFSGNNTTFSVTAKSYFTDTVRFSADESIITLGNISCNNSISSKNVYSNLISANNLIITDGFTVSGNVIFNGDSTNINSNIVTIKDSNITLGNVSSPTNVTADGGGITLKGSSDKYFKWVNSTSAWTSSENLYLNAGKNIILNGSTSGSVTIQPQAVSGTTTIAFPVNSGTLISTGDTGTVTSTMIVNDTIVNADINSSAAIAYSKLNLGNSIVNADISSSAAIAYSKLSLSNSIVNADISSSAAIAYSKLSLASSIVNADISSSAAIAISKLAASTISGISLGNNLNSLTFGSGFNQDSYNGSASKTITANTASTTLAGIVQLTDSFSSTSTTTAATPNSVKTAYDQATNAFSQANTATTNAATANTNAGLAFTQANTGVTNAATALSVGQSAFTQANTATTNAATALSVGQNAFAAANNEPIAKSAFSQANTALSIGQSAFAQANNEPIAKSAFSQANTALTVGQSAFAQANTATTNAATALGVGQSAFTQANTATTNAATALGVGQSAFAAANTKLSSNGGTLTGSLAVSQALSATSISTETLTVTQSFVNMGSTITDSNELVFQVNTGSPTSPNSYITVNRGAANSNVAVANAQIKWDNQSNQWQINDVSTGTFYRVISQQQLGPVYDVANTKFSSSGGTVSGSVAISQDLTVSGNLVINGTTSTINSTTISVDDKNIELGSVNSPSEATADGGGITLKGTTDKTFNWYNSSNAWTSSENLSLAKGKTILLNGSNFGTATIQAVANSGNISITLPNTAGSLISTGDTGIVTSSMIADGSILNSDINASAAIVYSKLSLGNSIVNADISSSAAIAYSKLSLGNSIVNADISSSAAIAYSKLNLSSSVVNADISSSAAIAYSKLNLGNSIVNADISSSAAIATSKLAANTISGVYLGNNLNTLTIGSGLSGTSYNGSSAVTIAVDSTVALKADTHYIGNTSVALNRVQGNLALAGISSVTLPGSTSGTTLLQPSAVSGTTTITLPATTGTVVTTGDTGTVTSSMIADGTILNSDINASAAIAISKLAASTISGVSLGNNLNTLTFGTGFVVDSYNGSVSKTITANTASTSLAGIVQLTDSISNTSTTTAATPNSVKTAYDQATNAFSQANTALTVGQSAFAAANNEPIAKSAFTQANTATTNAATALTVGQGAFTQANTALTVGQSAFAAANTKFSSSGGSISGSVTISQDLTVTGNLNINGTTSTINSTTVNVADINMILGNTASPTNVTADGGGITLKGTTDKTFNWVSSTAAWTSSEHIATAAGKSHIFNGSTSGSITLTPTAVAGTTTITLPATTGTVVTTGDNGTVTNAMLAGSIATSKITGLATSATTDTTNASNITSGTLPNARLSSIPNSALASSTISGVSLGSNLNTLTFGTGFVVDSYNGSAVKTITANTASTTLAGIVSLTDSISSTSTTTAATPNSVKTAYDLANGKFPTAGGTFTGNVIGGDYSLSRFMMKDNGYIYYNSNTTSALDYTNGSHQRWAPTGTVTLSVSNWAPTGNTSELLIEGVNLGAATITWPTVNWIKSDGTTTTTFSSNGITLQSSGTDWVILWTRDAGTTIYGKVIR